MFETGGKDRRVPVVRHLVMDLNYGELAPKAAVNEVSRPIRRFRQYVSVQQTCTRKPRCKSWDRSFRTECSQPANPIHHHDLVRKKNPKTNNLRHEHVILHT